MKNIALFALPLLAIVSCEAFPAATSDPSTDQSAATTFASGEFGLIGASGEEIGAVSLLDGPAGMLARVSVEAGTLSPGWHGLHFHQVGDCSDIGVYKLSGGHIGKLEGGHGLLNEAGPEAGDIPNIYAHSDGAAAMEFVTARTTLAALRDADGSAMIIHAGPDDHATQPIGGAGVRVACAEIK